MREDIRVALEEVRALLNDRGGDVLLLDVHDGTVHVQLLGAGESDRFPFTLDGMRTLVERELRRRVPDVRAVVAC